MIPTDDYIKRSDVIEAICERCEARCFSANDNNCLEYHVLNHIPAADVEPVVHGQWIDENPTSPLDPRMRCSVCGHIDIPIVRWRFCPNCGAKMDGGNKND